MFPPDRWSHLFPQLLVILSGPYELGYWFVLPHSPLRCDPIYGWSRISAEVRDTRQRSSGHYHPITFHSLTFLNSAYRLIVLHFIMHSNLEYPYCIGNISIKFRSNFNRSASPDPTILDILFFHNILNWIVSVIFIIHILNICKKYEMTNKYKF